jgi:peptide/nickel transport system substrate-binding protein
MLMRRSRSALGIVAMIVVLLAGCAAPSPSAPVAPSSSGGTAASQAQSSPRSGPKRIVVGILVDMPAFNQEVATAAMSFTALSDLERLVLAGLIRRDLKDQGHAELAEQVPTLENGLWKLQPDGSMEISYRIKENARWHDGTPFTTADLLFTADFWRDRDVPVTLDRRLASIASLEASDARTITVKWKEPLLDADLLFSTIGSPLPRHILEQPYQADKANILNHPYWSSEYVGTGPWKLKEFQRSSHIVLTANESYVLGRPKVDELEIKIIPDPNTMISNILSGTVDLGALGRGFDLERALDASRSYRDGRMEVAIRPWVTVYPQLMGGTPRVVEDLRFRKGLMHATDRQTMVETIQHGYGGVAHTYIGPQDPQFEGVKDAVPRYDYDLRRAEQYFQEVGLSKGPDGKHRDAAGQPLQVELRSDASLGIHEKSVPAIAAYWEQAGIDTEINLFPPQRSRELQWFAEFPGFYLSRQNNTLQSLRNRLGSFAPTAQNQFRGTNHSRYVNADFDRIVEEWQVTIDPRQSLELARQINRHIAENLNMMGIFYDTEPMLMANKLVNVDPPTALGGGRQVWRTHEWDVQ